MDGTQYVETNDAVWKISDDVQAYNTTTETWYTDSDLLGSALEQALAYSNDLTVYYDRTAATGGMIRVVTVE